MLLNPFARWYLSTRIYLSPDGATPAGGASPAAAAPAAKPATTQQLIETEEGGDPPELGDFYAGVEDEWKAGDPEDDTPGEPAAKPADQQPKPAEETAEQKTAREKSEREAVEQAKALEELGKEEAIPGDWPDSAKKRLAKLAWQRGEAARERDALKPKVEQLTAENATLKAGGSQQAPLLAPTPESPLAHVTDAADLDKAIADAEARIEWANENWDGGEYHKGPDGKPVELDATAVRKMKTRAEQMIAKHVPARREYLKNESAAMAYITKRYPTLADSSSADAQAFATFQKQFPQIKTLPAWPVILADTIRGQGIRLQEEAEQRAGKSATNGAGDGKAGGDAAKDGKEPPKPAPNMPGPVEGAPPGSQNREKPGPKLRASMDAEDLAAIM